MGDSHTRDARACGDDPRRRAIVVGLCLLIIGLVPRVVAATESRPRIAQLFITLADSATQGPAPTQAKPDNGNDLENNRFWGGRYGVRTLLMKHPDWELVGRERAPQTHVLERLIFRHRQRYIYLVVDAYRGSVARTALSEFLNTSAGARPLLLRVGNSSVSIQAGSASDLFVYLGHNAIAAEDKDLDLPMHVDATLRPVVMLTDSSLASFEPYLQTAGATLLLGTTGVMSPEGYLVVAFLEGWVRGETAPTLHMRVAQAYARYQRCSVAIAERLFWMTPEAATVATHQAQPHNP